MHQIFYLFKNPTRATKGLHILQLHSSPLQALIVLLKLEKDELSVPIASSGSIPMTTTHISKGFLFEIKDEANINI